MPFLAWHKQPFMSRLLYFISPPLKLGKYSVTWGYHYFPHTGHASPSISSRFLSDLSLAQPSPSQPSTVQPSLAFALLISILCITELKYHLWDPLSDFPSSTRCPFWETHSILGLFFFRLLVRLYWDCLLFVCLSCLFNPGPTQSRCPVPST